ncbi:cell wall-active antibiotics response protein [Bacillus sp. V3B]|uniref:cell wall-active antibiotics response protein LiaF n=1 Tax=Bacillus sp. V3B TaxID=2804915 RepID=UPI00210C5B3F|nr:cell wall-active antibiotics response protein LiaF [Bacillus sp. V3B]MCQ6275185.1 cell wall-active antibiotics response protein [Bacillus sp. V3B]
MFQKLKSDYLSWIVLIGAFFLLLDVFFFNRGLIFSLIVAIGMVYLGRKRMPKTTGKLLFWAGLFFLFVNVMNMLVVKFFLIALLCVLIFQYANKKQEANTITPIIKEQIDFEKRSETIIKEQFFVQNRLFGTQQTPDHVYEWNDVNIQTGVGDTVIDLSYTVLPKDETIIFIRNVMGKITILIPYDVEVSVHHSVFFGSAKILDFYESALINRLIKVETADYEQTNQKVKIFTSMMIGDLEVKRI